MFILFTDVHTVQWRLNANPRHYDVNKGYGEEPKFCEK